MPLGGFFDVDKRTDRLREIEAISQLPGFWEDTEKATNIQKERAAHESAIKKLKNLDSLVSDVEAALDLSDGDLELQKECTTLLEQLTSMVKEERFLLMMKGEFDKGNAIVEVNGGSGGTEAQDWAQMLLRMYTRWAERKGFDIEVLDYQPGEVAGIKNATILISGDYAYGFLRAEQGVHRLVRISPFDSNARRHTSFASVSVTPDIEQDVDITIDEKDLRIDTYRASGAGGQHVNKTDSAVRITHIPTGLVAASQSDRSQHKNKASAMKVLKAKLYEVERQKQEEKLDQIKGPRMKIDFGSQIRSYVMQPYQLIKDLRTEYETSSVNDVLDGDLDKFIEAYLVSGMMN